MRRALMAAAALAALLGYLVDVGPSSARNLALWRCRTPRECLHDLLRQPLRGRVPGHREPEQLSSTPTPEMQIVS